ncbi:MurR/RpiR family transcriptional regulator [Ochrobactrum cytisi]|nr:MurR/RpiR family transcriptional regulator [Brucella cytisi]
MPEHQRDIEQEIADFTSDDFQRFSERLTEQLDTMPKGLRTAARFVLSHPVDVALSSMRRQAKQVGVSHSTMVRPAEWMGLDGYDALRAIFRRRYKKQAHGLERKVQQVPIGDSKGPVTTSNGWQPRWSDAVCRTGYSIMAKRPPYWPTQIA